MKIKNSKTNRLEKKVKKHINFHVENMLELDGWDENIDYDDGKEEGDDIHLCPYVQLQVENFQNCVFHSLIDKKKQSYFLNVSHGYDCIICIIILYCILFYFSIEYTTSLS